LDRSSAFPSGKTNVTGLSGEAELAISISGRKGKGTIYVIATKSAGE
jgi:Cytochrome oxidase complex assembly protein 1